MLGGALALAVGLMAPGLERAPADAPTVVHRVRRHDTVATIASAFGVSEGELRAWNSLSGPPQRGQPLVVHPRAFPPLRHLRRVGVDKDDTWEAVATRYDVRVEDVRAWNRRFARRKRPPSKATLTLWLPSSVKSYPLPPASEPLPDADARAGGVSIGRPDHGRLRDGVRLYSSEHVKVRIAYQAYGSTLTVRNVQRAIAGFRQETGFAPKVIIGALSRRTGRRLRPHKSHQSGRDVDVRLPAMPHVEGHKLDPQEIDWYASFALIDAFVRTGVVSVIFLERKLFRRLRRAGAALGASEERIATVLRRVRHSKGHTAHFHVRFQCAPDSERCES